MRGGGYLAAFALPHPFGVFLPVSCLEVSALVAGFCTFSLPFPYPLEGGGADSSPLPKPCTQRRVR